MQIIKNNKKTLVVVLVVAAVAFAIGYYVAKPKSVELDEGSTTEENDTTPANKTTDE